MFDRIPPIRFIFLNWLLISFISPLVLILYQVLKTEIPPIQNFDFGMVFIYFTAILWSMAFSFFSVVIFGLIASLLNNHINREKIVKVILIVCIGPIIHGTLVFYVQDGFVKPVILNATFCYWLVAVFTIWFIPLNKD